jgi:tetratricopeptide (TPR) repeat protein
MCYLKLGLHDKALSAFEKAMEDNFDNSETFFYAAICLLKGKKAFLVQRPEIDRIEKYINAALAIEPNKGIYHYFMAYIKYDYFERKSLNTTPTYRAKLAEAKAAGISPVDIEQLFGILGVPRPDVL